MKTISIFQCEICNSKYPTAEGAKECEAQGVEKAIYKVGDVVKISRTFGWQDGDVRWCATRKVSKKMHDGYELTFLYVITAIELRPDTSHFLRYHLWTGAISGKQGYQNGWNTPQTHYRMMLVKKPPTFVRKDSKRFIGKKSKYLL